MNDVSSQDTEFYSHEISKTRTKPRKCGEIFNKEERKRSGEGQYKFKKKIFICYNNKVVG